MRPPLLLAALIAVLLAACGDGAPTVNINTGSAAPAFHSRRPDGSAVDVPAAYAGKPLVIRFWADWCKYCAGEMQAIDRVYRRHRASGLEVLAVNAGQDAGTVEAFMRRIEVGYPAVLDEDSAIARRYGVVGLPTTFFVDAGGTVRGKIVGESDEASFERLTRELLR